MDAFADLALHDPEDDAQPEMTSREARIARAFTDSKKSYSSEIVFTPPGWFQVETLPPGDLTKLDGRHLEWSVQRLYLQRAYKQAQTLALDVLFAAGVQLDPDHALIGNPNPNPHLHPAGTPLPKNEARDREMLDTAIRCALKLGDPTTANRLAKASRSRWTNNPGLGHTAGEALLFANKPWDAISALLHATRRRIPSHPVLSLLARALHAASTQRPNPSLQELANVVAQYAERTKPAFERGLFPDPESTKVKPKDKVNIPSEGMIRAWATEAGLDPIDVGLMVALCGTGDAEGDDTGERSVRTL
ncbi:hypothetical protein V565_261420 [Rhizoctonia solani 123E]|uniref:Uncharacterized protein n=1 Tax=Rhizoctonia solani 123E TaxID=1423351 RepID=A0A074REI5_9AGAM|nr:hypothetical protein V565_261420 [Rhizoctonia solani 123E]